MTRVSWKLAAKLAMLWIVVVWFAWLVQVDSAAQRPSSPYAAPRFPALAMKPPTSPDEVMPYARQAAHNARRARARRASCSSRARSGRTWP